MKDYYSIIKGPVITEKSTILTQESKVVFWVAPSANKVQVKEAVEKLFNVKVVGVNTEKVAGKMKRLGKFTGRRPTRKKAYVTLREGDKIELFEGV